MKRFLYLGERQNYFIWAVAVAHLLQLLLTTSQICGSNQVISNSYLLSTILK